MIIILFNERHVGFINTHFLHHEAQHFSTSSVLHTDIGRTSVLQSQSLPETMAW